MEFVKLWSPNPASDLAGASVTRDGPDWDFMERHTYLRNPDDLEKLPREVAGGTGYRLRLSTARCSWGLFMRDRPGTPSLRASL